MQSPRRFRSAMSRPLSRDVLGVFLWAVASFVLIPCVIFVVWEPFLLEKNGENIRFVLSRGYPSDDLVHIFFHANYIFIAVFLIAIAVHIKRLYSGNAPAPLSMIIFAAVSYTAIIHLYAAAYLTILYFHPNAIDYGDQSYKGMDVITAYYFSLITIATVGFGDIHPVDGVSKLVVMSEVMIGLFYSVFIFSILASLIRGRSA